MIQLILIAFVSGSIGAIAMNLFFRKKPTEAQTEVKAEIKAKTIEAQDFRLINRDGKLQGLFQVDSDGKVCLSMVDKDNNPLIILGQGNNGMPNLQILNKSRAGLRFNINENGIPFFILSNKHGKGGFLLSINKEGDPCIISSDLEGKTCFLINFINEMPGLGLADKSGKIRAWVTLPYDKNAILVLSDKDGKPI